MSPHRRSSWYATLLVIVASFTGIAMTATVSGCGGGCHPQTELTGALADAARASDQYNIDRLRLQYLQSDSDEASYERTTDELITALKAYQHDWCDKAYVTRQIDGAISDVADYCPRCDTMLRDAKP
jgi:hypothetical protein